MVGYLRYIWRRRPTVAASAPSTASEEAPSRFLLFFRYSDLDGSSADNCGIFNMPDRLRLGTLCLVKKGEDKRGMPSRSVSME
jgi:hypothetical protein